MSRWDGTAPTFVDHFADEPWADGTWTDGLHAPGLYADGVHADGVPTDDDLRVEAGDLEFVIEPDGQELGRLRAALHEWLAHSPLDPVAHADVVLVASELVSKAIASAGDRRRLVEIRCRYTHSIAVIEVTGAGAGGDADHAGVADDDGESEAAEKVRESVLDFLTSRVQVIDTGTTTTVRCTLSLLSGGS